MEQDGLSDGQKQIRSAFEAYGVKDYVVVQKGDVKAAVVGVFGKDALECAPTCELKFKDPVEAVKQTVEKIRKNEYYYIDKSGLIEDLLKKNSRSNINYSSTSFW